MRVSSYFDLRCHKLSIEADQQFPRVVKLASGGWMDMESPDGLGKISKSCRERMLSDGQ
jgi:hypothetical protein